MVGLGRDSFTIVQIPKNSTRNQAGIHKLYHTRIAATISTKNTNFQLAPRTLTPWGRDCSAYLGSGLFALQEVFFCFMVLV